MAAALKTKARQHEPSLDAMWSVEHRVIRTASRVHGRSVSLWGPLDPPGHAFYIGSMRNINNISIIKSTFVPNSGEKTGVGEGGYVDSDGTSPSASGTTSGAQPSPRRRGAQPGNRQALKHGAYAGANLGLKRQVNAFIRHALAVAEAVEIRCGGKPRRRRRKAVPA